MSKVETRVYRAIPQKLIKEYKFLRESRLELEREAQKNKKREDVLKESLLDLCRAGLPIQEGMFTVTVASKGRFPNWKDAFYERCGEEAAQEVIDATPYREELVVREIVCR